MNWESLRKGIGGLAGVIVEGAIINNRMAIVNSWMRMSDEGAFESIAAFVQSSPPQDVDQLDVVLLMMASGSSDEDTRRRLIKFYALFKMAEMVRYQGFRGFPR